MNKYKELSMNDIIFQGRNKSYGAYEIRQSYNQNISIATLGTLSILLLLMLLKGNFANAGQNDNATKNPQTIIDVEETIIDKIQPEEEITPPAARQMTSSATIDYSTVSVTSNEAANTIDPISNLDAFNSDASISNTNTQGTNDHPVLTSSDGLGTAYVEPSPAPTPNIETNQIHSFVQEMPQFEHGNVQKYILSKIVYPEIALENNIEGTVTAQVVIDQEGNVTDIKIIKDIGGGCGNEVARVLNNMPKWKPGKQNDKKVKVRINIPVKFKINQAR